MRIYIHKNNKTFINEANLKHNNYYNYSKVNYLNHSTKIIIICPKHGIFEQIPTSHLSGVGCSECSESKGETKVTEFLNKNNKLRHSSLSLVA